MVMFLWCPNMRQDKRIIVKKNKSKGVYVTKEYVGKSLLQQLKQQLDHVEDMINKMTAARDIGNPI